MEGFSVFTRTDNLKNARLKWQIHKYYCPYRLTVTVGFASRIFKDTLTEELLSTQDNYNKAFCLQRLWTEKIPDHVQFIWHAIINTELLD